MREYLFVLLVAAVVTYVLTPLVRTLAVRFGALTAVRDRDVHAVPTPRLLLRDQYRRGIGTSAGVSEA